MKNLIFRQILSVVLALAASTAWARTINAPAGDGANIGSMTDKLEDTSSGSRVGEKNTCPSEAGMGAMKFPEEAEYYNNVAIYCSYEDYKRIKSMILPKSLEEVKYQAGYLIRFMLLSGTQIPRALNLSHVFSLYSEVGKTKPQDARERFRLLVKEINDILVEEQRAVRIQASEKDREASALLKEGGAKLANASTPEGEKYRQLRAEANDLCARASMLARRKALNDTAK